MASMPRFDLTKPKPTVIRLINRRHTKSIMIEEGDESTLAREGNRFGCLLSQVRRGLWRPIPWGQSLELAEFLEAIAKGMEEEEAAFSRPARLELVAAQPAALPEPTKKKRTKKVHEIRALDPPLSATNMRLYYASDLAYTHEFPRCARTIRDHFEDIDEPGVHHSWQPETLHTGPYNELQLVGWYAYKYHQDGRFKMRKRKNRAKRKG